MIRWRYAGFVALLVMFYFAELDQWNYSRRHPWFEQTGLAMAADEMARGIETGSGTRQLGVLLIGAFGAFVLTHDRQRKLRIRGSLGIAILFFFLWTLASVTWSDDLDLAMRRVTCFAILWFAAFGVASHYRQREVLLFLFLAGLALVCLGLIAELILGTFAPADPLYRFCGTLHPNQEALNCAALGLTGIALGDAERHHRFFFFSASALGIATLALTKSRTGVGAFVIALVIYKALVSTRKQKEFWMETVLLLSAVLILFCGVLAFVNQTELASLGERTVLLGRGTEEVDTLTGRIPLWQSGLSYFYDRPLRGYGFNAFETPQRIIEIERRAGWPASTFHSEYFDLVLGVGCIGAITYVFIILSGLRRTLLLYKLHRTQWYALECAIIAFYLATMFLTNPGRDPNIPTFVFFTIMARRGLLREPELHTSPTLYLRAKVWRQPDLGPARS